MKRRARREALHVLTLLVAPAAALADDASASAAFPFTPPSYQVLRFNENYLYLSNPTNRTDWFDPIKYIPLRTNYASWYLTIGGELRERFEGNYPANFGIGGVGSDSYLLQRITLLTDLHLGERVRLFAVRDWWRGFRLVSAAAYYATHRLAPRRTRAPFCRRYLRSD
jgi:hypothetical protein